MDKHSEQGNKHAFVWNKEQLDSVDAADTDYLLGTFIHHVTVMIAMGCVCVFRSSYITKKSFLMQSPPSHLKSLVFRNHTCIVYADSNPIFPCVDI